MTTTPAGWYPDGQGNERYWDGTAWTAHTRPQAGATPAQPPAPQQPAQQPVQQPAQQPAQQGWGQPAAPQQQFGQQPFGQPAWGPPPGASGGGKGKLIAIIGAVVAVLVIALVVVLVVVSGDDDGDGGGGGSKSGPEGVVQRFFEGSQGHDCQAFEALSNSNIGASSEEERSKALETFVSQCEAANDEPFGGSGGGEGCDFEVTESTEDGDKADVTYEITGCDDEDDNGGGTIHLINEGGQWRIDDFD